eukprot:gene48535-63685_t
MECMTEVQLSPAGQDVQLRVTWVWDYIDHASLQCVLMGLCAHSIDEWFEFNEIDGLKPVALATANQGGSFHQSTYSQVKSASQVLQEPAATAAGGDNDYDGDGDGDEEENSVQWINLDLSTVLLASTGVRTQRNRRPSASTPRSRRSSRGGGGG